MNIRQLTFAFGLIATIAGATNPALAAPSPSKGVTCPTGFKADANGAIFRCVRRVNVLIENICNKPTFPKLNVRVGKDVCTPQNITVSANDSLRGLTENKDFVFSVADPQAVAKAQARLEQGFLTGKLLLPNPSKRPALVLPIIPAGEREAVLVNQTVKVDDASSIDDHTLVTFDVFTFPIKVQ